MNRETFMRELEYLLQDISEEEKADALAYYADYLDEAGPEKEEQVLKEFGSPERVAAMIRSEISGNLEDGGSFTDRGYEDERFRDPNYSVAPRMDLPEQREKPAQEGPQRAQDQSHRVPGQEARPAGQKPKTPANGWKIAFLILILVITCPLWLALLGAGLGLAGGVLGILVGLAAAAVGLLLCLALWTGAWLLGGLVAVIAGFVVIFVSGDLANAVWCIGTGTACIGVGLLSLAVCGLFYGKLIPGLFRAVIDGISRLVHRRQKRRERA